MTNDNDTSTREEDKLVIYNPTSFQPEEYGIGSTVYRSMQKYKQRIAQLIYDTGEEDTYEELLKRCVRVSCHLQERKLTRNDVIILCSYNQKNSVVPFLASLFINVPVASLDPTLSLMDTMHLIKEMRPKIIIVIPEFLQIIQSSLDETGIEAEIIIYGMSNTYTEFSTLLEPHENEEKFMPERTEDMQDTAVIIFSSGTTGLPKGIMLNHYTIMTQAYELSHYGISGSINLSYATLYWISTIVSQISTIQLGGTRIVIKTFDPVKTWFILDKYKVTNYFAAPSLAISMLEAGRPDGIDTTNLWSFVTGGSPIAEKYMLQLRDYFPGTFVFQAYGQTEVGGLITSFKINDVKQCLQLHAKPTSVGMLAPGLRAKVVDPETNNTCGPNEQGELRVKAKIVMNGYYNRDSSESFDDEGWLCTGDIAYYDEDKCFYIVDRIKEMLKYKSWHVPPALIEQILLTHPAVAQAVVIGIPHEEDGDHVMALIVPTETSKINVDDIISFVDERVPDRMRLRGGVSIINSIPITPSGKIKRRTLRNMVLNGDI